MGVHLETKERNKGAVSYIGVAVMAHNLNFSFLRHKYDRVTELADTFLLASCLDAFQKLLSLCDIKVSTDIMRKSYPFVCMDYPFSSKNRID